MSRPARISSFSSMERLGVYLLPLDGMLVYFRVTSSIKFAGTHLYTRMERGTVIFTQRPRPGLEPKPLADERTNCEATASPYHLGCLYELLRSVNSP